MSQVKQQLLDNNCYKLLGKGSGKKGSAMMMMIMMIMMMIMMMMMVKPIVFVSK